MGEAEERHELGGGTEITREREKKRWKNCVCIGTDFDVNAWKGKETADCSYRLLSSLSLSLTQSRVYPEMPLAQL